MYRICSVTSYVESSSKGGLVKPLCGVCGTPSSALFPRRLIRTRDMRRGRKGEGGAVGTCLGKLPLAPSTLRHRSPRGFLSTHVQSPVVLTRSFKEKVTGNLQANICPGRCPRFPEGRGSLSLQRACFPHLVYPTVS